MKLLYLLNERSIGEHIDVHKGLEKIKEEKLIERFTIYPFLFKISNGIKINAVLNEISEEIKKNKPNVVIWSHTAGLTITDKFLNKIKNNFPEIIHIYFDGDIYQKFYKPLPKEIIKLASFCDLSFWPGYAPFIELLRKKGCNDIRYVPLTSDDVRFSKQYKIIPSNNIVMIGNYISSRIPFKTFPGSKLRREIADLLFMNYDNKFELYGYGWGNRSYLKGIVPFERQGEIYNYSKISVGVNNLHAHYYFSNRLPISLTSGRIMVHNYEPGVEEIFADIGYPFFFKSKSELLEIIKKLLNYSDVELNNICSKYREFAFQKLTMVFALKYIIKTAYEKINNDKMITPNPWIKKDQL